MDQAMELIVDLQQELEEKDWLEDEVENLRKELEDARSEVNWLHSELHGAELAAMRDAPATAYIVQLFDELDDIGESYIPSTVFLTREAAEREVEGWGHEDTHCGGHVIDCDVVGPARTCKRLHIEGRNFMNGKAITFYKCSECDELMGGTGSYCPHCGAKVVE